MVIDDDLENLLRELGLGQQEDKNKKNTKSSNKVNGTLELKNGATVINKPLNFGKYPTIAPGKNVKILVNKKEIFQPTVISQEDKIDFELLNLQPEVAFDIEISEDNFKAYLLIHRQKGSEFIIQDQEPTTDLVVNGILEKEILTEGPSLQEIMKLLEYKKIVNGINEALIYGAVENIQAEELRVEIAQGDPLVESEEGKIVYRFYEKNYKEQECNNPYQNKVLASVAHGEVLAFKIPPKEGRPGKDIFGRDILPTPPKEANICIGQGVQLIEQESIAIATIDGRPYLDGKLLKVLPCYILNQNVDVEVGNFEFNGDIFIYGDVLDGFKVTALGSIEVHGSVLNAELEAGGDILITKSVVGSQVIAGRSNSSLRKIKTGLEELVYLLVQLLLIVAQVKKANTFKLADLLNGQGRLILLLINSRFKRIPELLKEMVDLAAESRAIFDSSLIAIIAGLYKKFSHYGPLEIKSTEEIMNIVDGVRKLLETIQPNSYKNAEIYVDYCQKSLLSASGNIVVTGKGCISSDMEAGQDIIVLGSPGVVRGGKLYAGQNIKINEIGSTAVVKVYAEFNEGFFEAKLVHPTLVIKNKNEVMVIEEDFRLVKAYKGKNGLQVEKLKTFQERSNDFAGL